MKGRTSIFILIIFGGVGIYLLWKVYRTQQQIVQMKEWVAYPAKLEDMRLNTRIDPDDGSKNYSNIVLYQYQVDGRSYRGRQVAVDYAYSNLERHFQIYDKIKYARKIRVWVNPDQPQESIIARGWNESALFFAIFTFIWICGVVSATLWELRYAIPATKNWSKLFCGIAITGFVLIFVRLMVVNKYDEHAIKIEDQIEVVEYMTDEQMERERLLRKANKEAFSRAKFGQDTVRIRLERDTFYVQ